MFRIKICGITSTEDALAAVDAGADALGLNFYEKSPRYVTTELAKEIVSAISGRAKCVGVFVNKEKEELVDIFSQTSLHGIQLHGDETPEFVAHFAMELLESPSGEMAKIVKDLREEGDIQGAESLTKLEAATNPPNLIWARRMGEHGVSTVQEELVACRDEGGLPGAILVDALTPGRYGGSGKTVSWAGLADYKKWIGNVELILAGGLVPENVSEAIRIVRPHGVDVASGVESSPGIKDLEKMRKFIQQAKAAFAEMDS